MSRAVVVVGITGASGAPYAKRLLEVLLAGDCEVHLAVSPSAAQVWEQELGWELLLGERWDPDSLRLSVPNAAGCLRCFNWRDYCAPMASGSFVTSGMVICPCSGDTLAAVAHGAASNLIRRAAEVHLKERRKLILVTRETPLSLPTIRNMQAVTEAGAVVLPASPGWYHGVQSVSDIVDFVVARIVQQLGLPTQLIPAWGCDTSDESGDSPAQSESRRRADE